MPMGEQMIIRRLIAVAAILAIPAFAWGSGFGLYDADARATGMAAAFVARADDASAIAYNPAGLAFLTHNRALVNLTPVQPHVQVSMGGFATDSEQRWVAVPSAFYAHKLSDDVALGFGVFAPIGLGVQYPENYGGSLISYRSMGMAVFFRPAIAFKVTDDLSLGGSVDFVYSKMTVYRKLPYAMLGLPIDGSIDDRTSVDGTGFGFSLGALYKLGDDIRIGATYRHEVDIDYEGDVDYSVQPSGIPMIDGMLGSLFFDQVVTSDITIPSEFTLGVMVQATPELSVSADLAWTGWSSVDVIPMFHEVSQLDQDFLMYWEDTWMLRAGFEYLATPWLALRGGYVRDNSPIPAEYLTPFAPDSDRNEFTGGIGYKAQDAEGRGYHIDAAIRYIVLDAIDSTFVWYPANYDTTMTFFALSFGYSF